MTIESMYLWVESQASQFIAGDFATVMPRARFNLEFRKFLSPCRCSDHNIAFKEHIIDLLLEI